MSERYEMKGKLGQGGSGCVYLAYDRELHREVAIKKLTAPDPANDDATPGKQDMILREARALSALQHPNIVTVYDIGEDSEGPFVVMEYLFGKTLDEVVSEATLPTKEFCTLVTDTLSGVVAAHQGQILHRDLKPSNIMLIWLPTGEIQFKILDFGIAKLGGPSQQTLGLDDTIIGSIHFMAPEQFERGLLDERTDLYALGCVYYFALTGRYPFEGEHGAAVMASHLQNRYQPLAPIRPDVPRAILDWVCLLFARNPEDRPPNAVAALKWFQAACKSVESSELSVESVGTQLSVESSKLSVERSPVTQGSGGNTWMLWSAAAMLVLLGGGTWFWLEQKGEKQLTTTIPLINLSPAAATSPAPDLPTPAEKQRPIVPEPSPPPPKTENLVGSATTVYQPTDLDGLREKIGQTVVVQGRIANIGESKTGKTRYINFDYRKGVTISVALRTEKTDDMFPKSVLESMAGQEVRVSGEVKENNGDLQLYIEKETDISMVKKTN